MPPLERPPRRRSAIGALACAAIWLSGCASAGLPTGIAALPPNRVPPNLLGMEKSRLQPLSVARLRRDPPPVYRLGPGDVLGVYVEGIVGSADEPPAVQTTDAGLPPALGTPVAVDQDGTLLLPHLPPLSVSGSTLAQAESAIRNAYGKSDPAIADGTKKVRVTLSKRRTVEVLVVRAPEDASNGGAKTTTVRLPISENDVLHALEATGGLPGSGAANEIAIYRGDFADATQRDALLAELKEGRDPCLAPLTLPPDVHTTRIPLRYFPDEAPRFDQRDIELDEGDIVTIAARPNGRFYTGGALKGGEFPLPADRDIDVLEAIAIAGGTVGASFGGGSSGFMNLGGGGGVAMPPTRLIILRRTAGGGQVPIRVDLNRALVDPSQRALVQPQDVIVLRYTALESVVNTIFSVIRFNFLINFNRTGL